MISIFDWLLQEELSGITISICLFQESFSDIMKGTVMSVSDWLLQKELIDVSI